MHCKQEFVDFTALRVIFDRVYYPVEVSEQLAISEGCDATLRLKFKLDPIGNKASAWGFFITQDLHLVGFLTDLQALGCDLYLHQQAIDTTTPSGKAMFQMCGVFAEFERSMIVERVNAGLKRAKAQGIKLGRGNRKDGARNVDEERWGMTRAELEKRILRLHKDGTGMLKIAKTLGVGTALVQGVVRPFEAGAIVGWSGGRSVGKRITPRELGNAVCRKLSSSSQRSALALRSARRCFWYWSPSPAERMDRDAGGAGVGKV